MTKQERFIKKIANFEPGCAPSVGLFEELILEARKVLNDKNRSNPEAQNILEYLIQLSERSLQVNPNNLKPINARLNEGNDVQTLMQVIELKVFEWKNNSSMHKHLHPKTLFSSTNFEKYLIEIEDIKKNPQKFKAYAEEKINKNRSENYDPLA